MQFTAAGRGERAFSNEQLMQITCLVTARIVARMINRRQEIKLRWKTVRDAHGYQVWMSATDPSLEANWEVIGYTTRVSHLITDLESFKAYFFCVSAIGVEGEGMQSDPASGCAA